MEINEKIKETKLGKDLQKRLTKSRSSKAAVNLWKINKHTQDGDTVVVPGKVLSEGELDHKVTIAALQFSTEAQRKIKAAGSKALSLDALDTTKGVRLMG